MKLTVRTAVRSLMVAGLLLSAAGAAAAAPAGPNTGPVAKDGVGTFAVGISGYAVVNADGTIARKLNAKTVTHTAGSGSYIVNFNSNVRGCAYTATIGLGGASGTSAQGHIAVVGAAASTKGVFVTTTDVAGEASERGFHLLVTC